MATAATDNGEKSSAIRVTAMMVLVTPPSANDHLIDAQCRTDRYAQFRRRTALLDERRAERSHHGAVVGTQLGARNSKRDPGLGAPLGEYDSEPRVGSDTTTEQQMVDAMIVTSIDCLGSQDVDDRFLK
jgi:hypothetical protein